MFVITKVRFIYFQLKYLFKYLEKQYKWFTAHVKIKFLKKKINKQN